MDNDDDVVREEEQAAAREAGRIGGRGSGEEDPAKRPVSEAGGGESEGFEQAEADLVEHAENSSGEGIPRLDQLGEEAERNPSVSGEADQEDKARDDR